MCSLIVSKKNTILHLVDHLLQSTPVEYLGCIGLLCRGKNSYHKYRNKTYLFLKGKKYKLYFFINIPKSINFNQSSVYKGYHLRIFFALFCFV